MSPPKLPATKDYYMFRLIQDPNLILNLPRLHPAFDAVKSQLLLDMIWMSIFFHAELSGLELSFEKLVEIRSCFTNLMHESNQKPTT